MHQQGSVVLLLLLLTKSVHNSQEERLLLAYMIPVRMPNIPLSILVNIRELMRISSKVTKKERLKMN